MKVVDLRELALKKVKISGNVIGKFGQFEIEQAYKNNTSEVLEVGYTFPIVETATVVGFEIYVGDKVLKGKCKEKGEAKKEYLRNMVKGNSSYLMEQETDNIFKISIGKIDKNEEVKIKIYYIDKFETVDNKIKILMPTLVTPKYKSNITSELQYGKVDYTVDFNIAIDKKLNRKSISCPSHKINVIDEEKSEIIEVLNYDLSKDFKLEIELKNELASNAITSKTQDGKDIVYLSFMPEILDTYEDSEKEYLFIIDVSGSMSGEKIDETKRAVIECLKQLDVGDKFNIIPFESSFTAMNINSIEYNEENMQKATEYVNNLRPLGGTEILSPIKFALYEKDVEKIILLFTDGQVGNEDEIIRYVNENVSRSRIFPFGIDTNVNSSFIKQLAKVGNGKAELIQPNERIDDKIIRTFARIQTPLLEKLEIDYGANKIIDEIKEDKCLFNYEFFNVFAKVEKIEDDIKLKGRILDKEYEWKISKNDISITNVDLEVLYAKQQMDRLEEYIANTYDVEKREHYKKMIIELAVKYNINSKYTSFITVYEREKKLFDVPKYQETKLSGKFTKDAILGRIANIFSADECDEYVEGCAERSFGGNQDRPVLVRNASLKQRIDRTCSESAVMEKPKSDREILEEKVEEYYKVFVQNEEKSILTYLLYAIYYLKNSNNEFNFDKFIEFLQKNKAEITSNELYMKLICLCYTASNKNDKLLEFFDEKYKKIIYTNMKIDVELNKIEFENMKEIIDNNSIDQKIDEILWCFCDGRMGWW